MSRVIVREPRRYLRLVAVTGARLNPVAARDDSSRGKQEPEEPGQIWDRDRAAHLAPTPSLSLHGDRGIAD
jgi:hypothetical protein